MTKRDEDRFLKDKVQRALLSWTLFSLLIISFLFLGWLDTRRENRELERMRGGGQERRGDSCWHQLMSCLKRQSNWSSETVCQSGSHPSLVMKEDCRFMIVVFACAQVLAGTSKHCSEMVCVCV